MSGIGLASGEMIHCSEPVIHEHPLLAEIWHLRVASERRQSLQC